MNKFYLSNENKYLGGVCGGLEEYTGIDAIFWRILFIFTANWSVGLYLILWIFAKTK
jgi:phage shock protein PspC (stress-responsive transcriptional regulator)